MMTFKVAMLGTGIMGAGMARSLLRKGIAVRAWNRTPGKAGPLAADGAVTAGSPAEAVAGADFVLTMLFDVDAVLEVAAQFAASVAPHAVWLQSSTIGLEGTKRVAAFAQEHGLTVVDAPVLGTRAPAEQGSLVVLASGPRTAIHAAEPVFDAIGARVIRAGDNLGDASALKLVCNAWVASINAATAQSIALATSLGLDPELFLEAITGTASDSQFAQLKGSQMIAGNFEVAFAVDGVVKDLDLIAVAAAGAGVDESLLAALRKLYGRTSEAGQGSSDMAAVATAFQRRW